MNKGRMLLANFVFVTLLFCKSVEGAHLHTIIICDTHAEDIGGSVEADFNRVRTEMHRIAFHTKLSIQESLFCDHQVNEDFIEWLKNYSVEDDDVVFLFFSGHGYRTESKGDNKWPNLFFTPIGRGVDFYQLFSIIREKTPRFFLAIADCCNNVLPETVSPELMKEYSLVLDYRKPHIAKNYKKLFLHYRGVIIASSSVPGQESWGSNSGGLFTVALFDSLKREVTSSQKPSWKLLLTRAQLSVLGREKTQTPQYEMHLSP